MHWRRKWQPTPVFLPGESQGPGSLVGCRLWGHTESDTTEATWRQQQQQWWVPGDLFYYSPSFGMCVKVLVCNKILEILSEQYGQSMAMGTYVALWGSKYSPWSKHEWIRFHDKLLWWSVFQVITIVGEISNNILREYVPLFTFISWNKWII